MAKDITDLSNLSYQINQCHVYDLQILESHYHKELNPHGSADQILLVKSNIKQEYDSMDNIVITIRL